MIAAPGRIVRKAEDPPATRLNSVAWAPEIVYEPVIASCAVGDQKLCDRCISGDRIDRARVEQRDIGQTRYNTELPIDRVVEVVGAVRRNQPLPCRHRAKFSL